MQKRSINGILLLDKPLHLSSNQALQKVKRLYQAEKAGHTGSLDPRATGMLPICLGEATKFSQHLLDADKQYSVIAKLGIKTATGDSEGEILEQHAVPEFSTDKIQNLFKQFTGKITQIPPMYSALKHKGKPLYELARQGISIERAGREITIYQLDLIACTEDAIQFTVTCSKGTYVRTLVEDLGDALGCGAHVTFLRRLYVESFVNQPMFTLEQLAELAEREGLEATDALLLPVDAMLTAMPKIRLSESEAVKIVHGQRIPYESAIKGLVRLYDVAEKFIGIGGINELGVLCPQRIIKNK